MSSSEFKEAFDLFGGDSDSGDDGSVIMQSVPQRTANLTEKHEFHNMSEINKVEYECCNPVLWKNNLPDYMGPALFVHDSNVGGCRGYIANQDIFPGTLIMKESALIEWPSERKDDNLFIDMLHKILCDEDNREDWMECISHIYPVSLEDIPRKLYEIGIEKYSDGIASLQTKVSFDKMLQIVFAMQCSSFKSGIFLHCSIFNHSCTPNCTKFNPIKGKAISEVRAARMIRKGEPLTISYIQPPEQSYYSRQQKLIHQFGFVCECPWCQEKDELDERFRDIENQIPEAEKMLEANNPNQSLAYALEILVDTLEAIPENSMPLIRIHKLVANNAAELLKVENEQFLEYAILFLRSSCKLYSLQKKYLNNDHIDLAGTLNDISQGINILLSLNPEILYSQFEWGTFREASTAENKYRQEYRRIRQLYE